MKIFNRDIQRIIEDECDGYRKMIEAYEKELERLPQGNLQIKLVAGKRRFYRYFGKNKKNQKQCQTEYLCAEDFPLIKQLARKKYIETGLRMMRQNYKQNMLLLQKYQFWDLDSISAGLPQHLKELPELWEVGSATDEKEKVMVGYPYNEAQDDYEQNPAFRENIIYFSSKGLGVRSKSESIIASLLEANNICFRYEEALSFGNHKYYPDFTINRPWDGRKIYWEHFGMIDNTEYLASMSKKLATYRENGIIEWDNLIVTCESEKYPFNTQIIDKIVKLYFIH